MKNRNAVALGRKGGGVRSECKAAAARENGKLGGRPRQAARRKEKGNQDADHSEAPQGFSH